MFASHDEYANASRVDFQGFVSFVGMVVSMHLFARACQQPVSEYVWLLGRYGGLHASVRTGVTAAEAGKLRVGRY